MNWLNYHHLFYFKQVVDYGSIAKASEKLKIGQPAISMQIKTLEDYLDKKLFERIHKKLVLTETGQIVYEYASQIFNLGNELLTTLNDRAYNHIKIQIGIQSSVPKNLISKLTSYIYKHFNSVISIYDGTLDEVTLGVISHKLDIAVLNRRPVITDKTILFSKRILSSPIVLAASKDFMHLKNKPISAFGMVPMILPTAQSSIRHSIEHYFSQHNVEMNIVGEADDTIVQKNMAISGNGVIPILKEAIESYVKNKQLYILKEISEIQDEVWLVAGKRNIANPIGHKLITDFQF